MQIMIRIDTDNAAFEDNPNELASILAKVSGIVDYVTAGTVAALHDSNGNRVGNLTIVKADFLP